MSEKLVVRDNPEIEIVGTYEVVYGTAHVFGAKRGPGGLEVDYAGETTVHWNSQKTVTSLWGRVFVDEDGNLYPETKVCLESEVGK